MDQHDRKNIDLIAIVRKEMASSGVRPAECPDAVCLAGYLAQTLLSDEKNRIEQHLVECNACRGAVIVAVKAERTFCFDKQAAESGKAGLERLLKELETRLGGTVSPHPERSSLPHVMIVDDDERYLHALEDTLTGAYRVTACRNGREALDRLTDNLRAIVLDIKMPEMDGFEVARRINRMKNAPPIIFNTAFPGQYQENEIVKKHKFFEYVTKDKPALLFNAIKRSCNPTIGIPE